MPNLPFKPLHTTHTHPKPLTGGNQVHVNAKKKKEYSQPGLVLGCIPDINHRRLCVSVYCRRTQVRSQHHNFTPDATFEKGCTSTPLVNQSCKFSQTTTVLQGRFNSTRIKCTISNFHMQHGNIYLVHSSPLFHTELAFHPTPG